VEFVTMHLLVEMHQVPEKQNPPSSRREFVVESSVSEVRRLPHIQRRPLKAP
jgi:hypothetical protein